MIFKQPLFINIHVCIDRELNVLNIQKASLIKRTRKLYKGIYATRFFCFGFFVLFFFYERPVSSFRIFWRVPCKIKSEVHLKIPNNSYVIYVNTVLSFRSRKLKGRWSRKLTKIKPFFYSRPINAFVLCCTVSY